MGGAGVGAEGAMGHPRPSAIVYKFLYIPRVRTKHKTVRARTRGVARKPSGMVVRGKAARGGKRR